MKNLVILGSTGSIGVNALKIVEERPDRFNVIGLAAKSNMDRLIGQIEKFRPEIVSMADPAKARELKGLVKTKVVSGVEGTIECASHPDADMALSAMVGAAGLAPTLAAVKAGKDVALANKETLVTAGELVMREARAAKVKIIPVDSEHSAIFQALRGEKLRNVRTLILTASSGPFIHMPAEQMRKVTVEQALNHPNWSMGKKITIDSATMMNKGLEVIEARWLFNIQPEKIKVVVHPQSVIHSMVEFCDSSVIAQMGLPDMRAPIAFALNYPSRLSIDLPSLDLPGIGSLTFAEPDHDKFPALSTAYEALATGGSAPAVLNAANEAAVEAFLDRKIAFTTICEVVDRTLQACDVTPVRSLADALRADKWARKKSRELIGAIGKRERPDRGLGVSV